MSIVLEDSQRSAVNAIKKWFTSQTKQQRFILAGLAGTGKTTIVKCIIEELNLAEDEVCFCAFTGKAAMVLTQKGTPAVTMHKLMYDVSEDPLTHDPVFTRKDRLDKKLRLIVVDEASMVSKEMQKDIESYEIKILYVGDHGQLPPVGDEVNNLMTKADETLEKIHRQAEGNPIIFMAKLARLGAKLPYKQYGDSCIKISPRELTVSMLTATDQILCGKNATRTKLNNRMRSILGFTRPQVQPKDKIICLRNNWLKGFINGMTGTVAETYEFDKEAYATEEDWWRYPCGTMAMSFQSELGENHHNVPYDEGVFVGQKPDFKNRYLEAFDFAYAITVHKSQGSQYLYPIVMEEYLGNSQFHAKWLYTAITRAANGIIIVGTGK